MQSFCLLHTLLRCHTVCNIELLRAVDPVVSAPPRAQLYRAGCILINTGNTTRSTHQVPFQYKDFFQE